jgi:hypothetical protein
LRTPRVRTAIAGAGFVLLIAGLVTAFVDEEAVALLVVDLPTSSGRG